MYGWIVEGISSLFEPVRRQNSTDWPGKILTGEEEPTQPGVETTTRWQESPVRPAKRNHDSVYVAEDVYHTDEIKAKRPKRDVVVSFVKKTLSGVASLLRRQKSLTTKCENARQYLESQPVTLLDIDELKSSWPSCSEWRMDERIRGFGDKSKKNPFQSLVPPLNRKYSSTALNGRLSDRLKDTKARRGSLQVQPSRPAIRMGASGPDTKCNSFGNNRYYKPSLTVEETIKQNNKEHYRRLLEMVTEKYNKSQPLPFNQSKPQDELSQVHKTAVPEKTIQPVQRKAGYTTSPSLVKRRNGSVPKERWSSLTLSKSFSGALSDTQPVRRKQHQNSRELDLSTEVATRLSLVDKPTSAGDAHMRLCDEDIPRLTKEMATEVSKALAQRDPNLLLSAAFKLRITQRDLATLQEGCWLNDEIINFYFSLITERCYTDGGQIKVYSFSTFFFPKLHGGRSGQAGGHAAVKRWTKTVDLFLFDLILVPLHLGVHWALAVIDFRSKIVKSYDSMDQRHDDICSLLLLYLKEEHRARKGKEFDCTKWTTRSLKAGEIPQQRNGSDCGVFACKYADYITRGMPLIFKQCHMPVFRKLMMWEILNQTLL